MTLTLSIEGVDNLGNGMPTEFVLHQRGATIGRAPTCDWCLPDPQRYISSRHSEISYRDGAYWLTDVSTNGTYLNSSTERLQGEHQINQGDVIAVGRYTIRADLSGSEAGADEGADASEGGIHPGPWDAPAQDLPPDSAGDEWGDAQRTPSSNSGWQPIAPQQSPADRLSPARGADRSFEWGAAREEYGAEEQAGWSPSHDASGIPHGGSVWEAPESGTGASSEWSSAAPDRPPEPKPTDIWGQIAEDNVVDWARSGFGTVQESAPDPLARPEPPSFGPAAAPPRTPTATPHTPPSRQRAAAPRARRAEAMPSTSDAGALGEFLKAAGLGPDSVKGIAPEVLAHAGSLVRALVAGLYVLVEARARAKAQLGAESTRLEFDGNNPIKFARSPEEALAQLLNPAERGFMDGQRAVEDAFYDLQSHQMATLKAMQGALRATLDRFSPSAIRSRADDGGFLASILPGARDAALWQAYEREFSGVASGSDEAFMDVFAKEFKKAYEEQSRLARQSSVR